MLRAVEDKVWEWVVPSDRLPEVRKHHRVSGTIRRAEGVHVRIVADAPPAAEARRLAPTLEDAYLHAIAR
jgi:hypothetical protein